MTTATTTTTTHTEKVHGDIKIIILSNNKKSFIRNIVL